MSPLGQRMRQLRRKKRLLQKELAEKAGVTQAFVSDIEVGKKSPSLRVLARLAIALDVSPHELLDPGNDELKG